MPRGVFRLFWDELLCGNQIGAYVVNRAKDGTHYWVFALAFPVAEGFISVRLKPSGPIFQTVKKKYAELLTVERARNISPAESKAILLHELQKLGFRDYQHFVTEALTQEMELRQKALAREPIQILSRLLEVSSLGGKLQSECRNISAAYAKTLMVPLNLEVTAARIGREAVTLTVVSSQYDATAKQINSDIKDLLAAANRVEELSSNSCKFDACSLLLLREVIAFFREEADADASIDKGRELSFLETASQANLSSAMASLNSLEEAFNKFKAIHEEVRMQATALEIISVTGKIEAVKVRQSSELMNLLNELNAFKTILKECLKSIDESGHALLAQISQTKSKLA